MAWSFPAFRGKKGKKGVSEKGGRKRDKGHRGVSSSSKLAFELLLALDVRWCVQDAFYSDSRTGKGTVSSVDRVYQVTKRDSSSTEPEHLSILQPSLIFLSFFFFLFFFSFHFFSSLFFSFFVIRHELGEHRLTKNESKR